MKQWPEFLKISDCICSHVEIISRLFFYLSRVWCTKQRSVQCAHPPSASLLHVHAHRTVSDTLRSFQPKPRGIPTSSSVDHKAFEARKEGRVFHPIFPSVSLISCERGNKEPFWLLRTGWKPSRFCDLLLGQRLTSALALSSRWHSHGSAMDCRKFLDFNPYRVQNGASFPEARTQTQHCGVPSAVPSAGGKTVPSQAPDVGEGPHSHCPSGSQDQQMS